MHLLMPANVAQGSLSALCALLFLPRLSLGTVTTCPDPYCSGHGSCLGEACECEARWAGIRCEQFLFDPEMDAAPFHSEAPPVEECPMACSGHGNCEVSLCRCFAGWTGVDCATEAQCPDNCNSPSGRCIGGQCVCADGFSGTTCAEMMCANGCWGHGACQDGRCACIAGWTGDQCEVANPEASPAVLTQTDAISVLQQDVQHKEVNAGAAQHRTSLESITKTFVQKIAQAKHAAELTIAAAGALGRSSVQVLHRSGMNRTREAAPAPSPAPAAAPAGALQPPTCFNDCSAHGTCNAGVCACSGGWTGEACDIQPCPENCLGRGHCLMGTCLCNEKYFGEKCELHRCLNDCSGNGVCNDGQCECNIGFEGLNCGIAIPGAAGDTPTLAPKKVKRVDLGAAIAGAKNNGPPECPMKCSQNGKCNPDGSCSCFTGYTGEACQDFCPNLCSAQGHCTDGACLCLAGWTGVDCSIPVCCSGHGDCSVPDTCICDEGWMGTQCEVAMQCADPECSSHGTCEKGSCDCDGGWRGDICDKPPEECGACPPGAECDRTSGTCMCGMSPCKGKGKGKGKQGGGGGDKGKGKGKGDGGPSALGNIAGQADAAATAAKGADKQVIDLKGDCNSPNGEWNMTLRECDCEGLFHGKHCELKHCPGFNETEGTPDCNGHGMCINGNCLCSAGWGVKGGKPNACNDPVCPIDCGEHGMCQNNVCACQAGWQGPACREPKCANDCSGHGTCSFVAPSSPGQCICHYGWTLPDCSTQGLEMTLPTCPNACSGNGLCLDGKCVCTEGFSGPDCSTKVCPPDRLGPDCQEPRCLRDCDGKGLCALGKCICPVEFMGTDCSIPVQCYEACHHVCDVPGKPAALWSEKCEFCKGQCITMQAHPILGRHNAFRDIITLQKSKSAFPPNTSPNPKRLRHPRHLEVQVTEVRGAFQKFH